MRDILLASSAAIGWMVLNSAAVAQTPQAPSAQSSLEDIVVTAQKREQNLQNVPVAVTALSSEKIAAARIVEFADLTRVAPSLTITQTNSAPNNSINLRGIGTAALSTGVEPSVAVIIDDMPVVQQAQAFDNLSDVERIEVLNGPQGTLFGKNASAGVVNIVTKDPDAHFGGRAGIAVASDRDVRAEAALSVPVSDDVGLRLNGFYHSYPGNVRNLTTGDKLNDQENYGFRAKLKARATDTLTFTLIGAYNKSTQDGTVTTIRQIAGTGTPAVFGVPSLALLPTLTGITPGPGNYRARVDTLGPTTNRTASVEGRINLDLGFANLISITAYQDWKYDFQNDADNTDLNVLRALTGGAVNGGLVQSGPYHSHDLTQELRLVSSGRGPLKYVGGVFYSDAQTSRAFLRGPTIAVANWLAHNSSRSLGVFGQVDYTLPTNTTISGGVRWNHERIGVDFANFAANATANTCASGNPLCQGHNTDSVVTWKGAISQQLARQIMVYGSVARGYKGYAYDITTGFNPARINAALNGTGAGLLGVGPVKPETSTSYEAGVKSRFLDNKVQLNVIGFLTDYKNFQAQSVIFTGTPPTTQSVLNNVGKLRTKGVEVEASAKPTNWLRLDAGAAYTDAIIRSFTNAQAFSGQTGQVWNGTSSALVGPCTAATAATAANPRTLCTLQDRSGSRLPNAPKFKWTLGATGKFPIGDSVKGTAIIAYQHQSKVGFDLLGNPLTVQNGYGVLNGSLGAEFGRFTLTAFVNNLLNKHYASSEVDNFSSLGGSATNDAHVIYQYQTRDSQRYGGLKLSATF